MKSNKLDTFLALVLPKVDYTPKPVRLKLSKDTYSSNPLKILKEFHRQLSNLYKNPDTFDQSCMNTLFSTIHLPSLSSSHREALDRPITAEEIKSAIKSLKPCKCPGPDGFSVTYYKCFAALLIPFLIEAFNSLLKGHSLHAESLIAAISMIPKPNTNDITWSNYIPLSMLNLDIKLLAKNLSTRFNPIIGTLVHKHQTLFIPSRQAGDNICRATLLAHAA